MITNVPSKAGQLATRKEVFGEYSRYAVFAVHTRFDAVEWFVADAMTPEAKSGLPSIVRQAASREEAIAGLAA